MVGLSTRRSARRPRYRPRVQLPDDPRHRKPDLVADSRPTSAVPAGRPLFATPLWRTRAAPRRCRRLRRHRPCHPAGRGERLPSRAGRRGAEGRPPSGPGRRGRDHAHRPAGPGPARRGLRRAGLRRGHRARRRRGGRRRRPGLRSRLGAPRGWHQPAAASGKEASSPGSPGQAVWKPAWPTRPTCSRRLRHYAAYPGPDRPTPRRAPGARRYRGRA
jgi:hypothetical protein